jgi:hypothetical protein
MMVIAGFNLIRTPILKIIPNEINAFRKLFLKCGKQIPKTEN